MRLTALFAAADSPALMRKLNGWATVFWIVMIPASFAFGWVHSVAFISALSLWALVAGHLAAWQASRVECTQQAEAEERHRLEAQPARAAP